GFSNGTITAVGQESDSKIPETITSLGGILTGSEKLTKNSDVPIRIFRFTKDNKLQEVTIQAFNNQVTIVDSINSLKRFESLASKLTSDKSSMSAEEVEEMHEIALKLGFKVEPPDHDRPRPIRCFWL